MDPNQLAFNLAVRDWASQQSYTMATTGDDEKLTVKYKSSSEEITDDELELRKSGIERHLRRLAFDHELTVDLDFTDLGHGDKAVFITMKPALTRVEASAEYYDLLYLGYRRTADQLQRLNALKKRYGFI